MVALQVAVRLGMDLAPLAVVETLGDVDELVAVLSGMDCVPLERVLTLGIVDADVPLTEVERAWNSELNSVEYSSNVDGGQRNPDESLVVIAKVDADVPLTGAGILKARKLRA